MTSAGRDVGGLAMTKHLDFTSQEYFRDPAAGTAKLRAAGPVVKITFPLVGTLWTTTTQDLANQLLRDTQTFSLRKDDGGVAGLRWWMPKIVQTFANNMLTNDEPDHTRLRGIVDEAFRRRAVLDMEPRVLAIGRALAYRPKFTDWASNLTRFTGPVAFLGAIPKIFAMKRYMEERLEAARNEGGTGLIAELVRVEKEGGRISRDEMVAMLFLLLFAGHETTTHLISGSVYELLRNPPLRDWLEQDWGRANLAVEEFLRFVSPVQFTKPRFVRKDVELGGVALKKGDKIMAMLAAANFDPQANEHPERLDLERRPNRHIAFGAGIHFCLGHQLARMEGKCALQALLQRWPKLQLAIDDSKIRWRSRAGFRAIDQLPVMKGG